MPGRFNIARLRGVLLAVLVLGSAALVALFLFGRAGQNPSSSPRGNTAAAQKGMTLIGEGFDYTLTDAERPVFRIRGESIRADRKDTVFLDGVGITLYDPQGQPYHVESKEASFNRSDNEGRLRGDVFLRGPGDLQIRTAQLQIQDNGRKLVAPRPVQILYGGRYFVRCDSMQVFLPDDVFLLTGNVRIQSLPQVVPPLSLFAARMVYERKQRTVRLEGGAQIHRGSDQVDSRRMVAFLTPDETGLVFVRALWEVSGRLSMQQGSTPTMVHFGGDDVAVDLEAGNLPRKVVIDGGKKARARMQTSGGGIVRVLAAARLEATLVGKGILNGAKGWGGVDLRETAPPPPGSKTPVVRQARGQRGDARFRPDGQLAGLNFFERIVYQDGEARADADRAVIDLDAGRSEMFGNPVVVVSPRGEVRAPHAVYLTQGELVQADGGVRARLEKESTTAFAGSPLGEGEGPIFVEAKEGFWRRQPSSFLFRGDVRAWRGDNILFAAELRGDQTEKRVNGTGGVKTLLRPTPRAGQPPRTAPAPAAGAKGAASTRPAGPVEVTAGELQYLESSGVLTYTTNVRAVQDGRTLTCDRLTVELDDDRRAKTMTCTGAVHLVDPHTGRDATGQKAVYRLTERKVDMFGEPVKLIDREGNVLQGKQLLYTIDDGKVEVKSTAG